MLRFIKGWLNIKVILGALLFGLGVFALMIWFLWSAKAKVPTQSASTPLISIIKAPTQTPPMPKVTQTATPEPTSATSRATPLPRGDIAVGDYVEVKGTEGDGLRLHAEANLSSEVRYLAIEAEVFVVKDGPVDADGYTWWNLEDPYTKNPVGWGVSNYLNVVRNP